jgi:microcystin-dependent protein
MLIWRNQMKKIILFCGLLFLSTIISLSAQSKASALRIIPNGNVGIGIADPSEKLDVAGNIRTSSDIIVDGVVRAGDGTVSITGNIEVSGRIQDKTGVVMPVGTVIAFAGTLDKIPEGWLLCDGAILDRNDAEYAELFATIGTAWGAPDAGHFYVPDMRGMFLRGVAGDATTDPDKATRTALKGGGNEGNEVGSTQEDEFANHNHSIDTMVHGSLSQYHSDIYKLIGDGETVTSSKGGNETRPVNVYVYYIIKY